MQASPVNTATSRLPTYRSRRHHPPGQRPAQRAPVKISNQDVLTLYEQWPAPTLIVSDGAYGLGSFPGDPVTADGLRDWYEPHVKEWSKYSTGQTTLWFWNSELGWATVHPLLVENGWEFRNCHVWDKGKAHIAGNANTKTLRKFPVVTEVRVQYVKKVRLTSGSQRLELKDWLRAEWKRTGLPFSVTNQVCGVANAATRKYFTKCHLWYWPPTAHFQKLADYANEHGDPSGRPYFSQDGLKPMTSTEWELTRSKFVCEYGISNVWTERPNRGIERVKSLDNQCIHANQKPLKLLDLIVRSSSDEGDVVWEPFGGLCSVAVSCVRNNRACFSAEVIPEFFAASLTRLHDVECRL